MKPLIFSMGYTSRLGEHLHQHLQAGLGTVQIRKLPDEEWYVKCETPVADTDVLIVANLTGGAQYFLPLLFLADTLQDLGASSVGLVAPYLPYMRQDKRFEAGEGVSSQYFGRLLSEHFDWLVTVDPHLHRFRSLDELFSVPTRVVHAAAPIAEWIRQHVPKPLVVGPDSESFQWVAAVASTLGIPFELLSKVRNVNHDVEVAAGRFEPASQRTPVLINDHISTGKTMIAMVRRLRAKGFAPPVCIGTHGIFVGKAFDELRAAGCGRVVTCNTIEHASNAIDLEPLIAKEVAGIFTRMRSKRMV